MGGSQGQLEEFVYCAKSRNLSADVSEVRKDSDHCVEKFNFPRRQMSPLLLLPLSVQQSLQCCCNSDFKTLHLQHSVQNCNNVHI